MNSRQGLTLAANCVRAKSERQLANEFHSSAADRTPLTRDRNDFISPAFVSSFSLFSFHLSWRLLWTNCKTFLRRYLIASKFALLYAGHVKWKFVHQWKMNTLIDEIAEWTDHYYFFQNFFLQNSQNRHVIKQPRWFKFMIWTFVHISLDHGGTTWPLSNPKIAQCLLQIRTTITKAWILFTSNWLNLQCWNLLKASPFSFML